MCALSSISNNQNFPLFLFHQFQVPAVRAILPTTAVKESSESATSVPLLAFFTIPLLFFLILPHCWTTSGPVLRNVIPAGLLVNMTGPSIQGRFLLLVAFLLKSALSHTKCREAGAPHVINHTHTNRHTHTHTHTP